ncbi:PspC domain-containing protein [Streptomyces sp. LP05-1]|uniref:PspC domain-containing protein n=1 Tax=Streptomyces pyxinae TaxID=2970734 RepID=A0ABT2CI75_9ACTN|nr:PspC domain-containing protein [Streptomyces sp. LP05-1]MCS0637106.1 PspC domain-containing protein [Streptomyces sp. LP05-1]
MTSTQAAPPPSAPEAPPPARPHRTVRRKVVAGVCGGLGRHFDLDPVIFRVVTGVLALAGGFGLIFYGFAWLLLPADGEEETEGRRLLSGRVDGASLIAVLMALVGCGLALSMLANNGGTVSFSVLLVLAVSGAAVWSRRRRPGTADPAAAPAPAGTRPPEPAVPGGGAAPAGPPVPHAPAGPPDSPAARAPAPPGTRSPARPMGEAPPEPTAPPPPDSPSWWRDPIVKDGTTGLVATGYLWGPSDAVPGGPGRDTGPGEPYGSAADPWRGPVPRPGGRRPRSIGGAALLLALVAGAVATAVPWGDHPLGVCLQFGLASALAVFALALLVSAFAGRTGPGTIVMTVLTALLLAGASALPHRIGTDWTRTEWRPAAVSELRPRYALGAGVGTLDLSSVAVAPGSTVRVAAEVGAGQLRVIVPEDVTVTVRAQVGLGDVQLPSDPADDVEVAPDRDTSRTVRPPKGAAPAGTLELRLNAAIGQVEVVRAAR